MQLLSVHGIAEEFLSVMTGKMHYMYGIDTFDIVGGFLLLRTRYVFLRQTLFGSALVKIIFLRHCYGSHRVDPSIPS